MKAQKVVKEMMLATNIEFLRVLLEGDNDYNNLMVTGFFNNGILHRLLHAILGLNEGFLTGKQGPLSVCYGKSS